MSVQEFIENKMKKAVGTKVMDEVITRQAIRQKASKCVLECERIFKRQIPELS